MNANESIGVCGRATYDPRWRPLETQLHRQPSPTSEWRRKKWLVASFRWCPFARRTPLTKVRVARWREDVILAGGSSSRVMRSLVLGPVSGVAGGREVSGLLDAHLNPVSQASTASTGPLFHDWPRDW